MDKAQRNQWLSELDNIVRGASGGFLFGTPLLYTMEVWSVGSSASPVRLLLAIVFTFAIVFMLNQTAGFRETSGASVTEAAMDTVEALAIGIFCTGIVLVLLREISLQTPLNEGLGKLIYESVPFSLGVALSNQFLGEDESRDAETGGDQEAKSQKEKEGALNATLTDLGGTLIGATIVAFNIAPTDEVPLLVGAVSGFWLLAVMIASVVISYAIVFAAGFANQQKRRQQEGIFQSPSSETIVSYLFALFAAALMLVFFNRLHLDDPWQIWLNHSIVLGLPAAIGGAAGRLAV